jgi:hypothetical protein
VFAIPVVFVAAGLAGAEISGVVPDTRAIARLLEGQDGVGPALTFALGQALCAATALETDLPSQRYARLRSIESGSFETQLDMIPAPIRLESAEESVHLRFLVGSVVASVQTPSFLETAAHIGSWGMPLSRELLTRLGRPGLSLLPLPRPPAGWMKALHEGRRAREEVAFQAFVSRVLRRMRSETGEPDADVAALESGAIGVRHCTHIFNNPKEIDQALSVVRALANEPRIVILDEATSNLDPVTEARIDAHLSSLSCTRIVIAHRPSTVRNADHIVVLEEGKIVESGNHDQLLQANSYYAELAGQPGPHFDEEICKGDGR